MYHRALKRPSKRNKVTRFLSCYGPRKGRKERKDDEERAGKGGRTLRGTRNEGAEREKGV